MREILFKAKRLDNGQWVEGAYIHRENWLLDEENKTVVHFILVQDKYGFTWRKIKAETLCQYTGMTDKDGNKIWENDIVERYYDGGRSMCISKILWADYGLNEGWCCKDIKNTSEYPRHLLRFLHRIGFGKRESKSCEVIGNIFDNPELVGDSEV